MSHFKCSILIECLIVTFFSFIVEEQKQVYCKWTGTNFEHWLI